MAKADRVKVCRCCGFKDSHRRGCMFHPRRKAVSKLKSRAVRILRFGGDPEEFQKIVHRLNRIDI